MSADARSRRWRTIAIAVAASRLADHTGIEILQIATENEICVLECKCLEHERFEGAVDRRIEQERALQVRSAGRYLESVLSCLARLARDVGSRMAEEILLTAPSALPSV